MDLVMEVQALKMLNMENNKNITLLQVLHLFFQECYWVNDLIIIVIKARLRSYVSVVATAEEIKFEKESL